jgi:hypothetical protein
VAEEAAPFGFGQCPPATFGVRPKRIDDAAPVVTGGLGLADLRAESDEQPKSGFRRRLSRQEVGVSARLFMAVRYQTAAGQSDDQPSVTLIEQAQDHVHGGQTGADDRDASIRGNLGQSRLVPRIGDVPGKVEVADGLAREGRGQVSDAERDMIVGCRRSAPEG